MSGLDDNYLGETVISKGYTRGMLVQEPVLDENKTVKQVVEEAVVPLLDSKHLAPNIHQRPLDRGARRHEHLLHVRAIRAGRGQRLAVDLAVRR